MTSPIVKSGQQVKYKILVKVNNSCSIPKWLIVNGKHPSKRAQSIVKKCSLECWSKWNQNSPYSVKFKFKVWWNPSCRIVFNQGQSAWKISSSLSKNSASTIDAKTQVKQSQTYPKHQKVNVGKNMCHNDVHMRFPWLVFICDFGGGFSLSRPTCTFESLWVFH